MLQIAADCASLVAFCSFVGQDPTAFLAESSSGQQACPNGFGDYYHLVSDGSDPSSSNNSSRYYHSPTESDESDDEETVVPKAPAQLRLVAYVLPTSKHSDLTEHILVYTSSSALPLLVPVKPKWSKGELQNSINTLVCC